MSEMEEDYDVAHPD